MRPLDRATGQSTRPDRTRPNPHGIVRPWRRAAGTTLADVNQVSRHRRIPSAIALVIGVLALTGCLSLETRFDINADGTADVGITMLVDTSTIRMFGEMFGEEVDDLDGLSGEELIEEFVNGENPCDDFGDFGTGEVTVREVADGDRRGISCSVDGVSIAELNEDPTEGEGITILQDDEGTSVRLVFPAEDIVGDTDDLGMFGLSFEELFDVRFVVSAPGSLVEHNGSSTQGSTVFWQLTPDSAFLQGDDAVMTARWSGFAAADGGDGDGGLSPVVIIAIIVGLLIVVAAVVLVLRSKGSGGSPTASAPMPTSVGGPMPGTGSAPPPPPAAPPAPPAPPTPPPPPPPPPPSS